MLQNEIDIIGGGISGLYLALLLSSHTHIKINVYEKQPSFGGRIRTEYDKEDKVLFETGPWRIHPTHKLMLSLVHTLGLEKTEIWQKIHNQYRLKDTKPNKELKNTVTEFQKNCYDDSIEFANLKMLHSGYDLLSQRANGTSSYSYKPSAENLDRFFVLKDGFSSVIKNIVTHLENCPQVSLFPNHRVTDVCYENKVYTIHAVVRKKNEFFQKKIRSKCVIIASPPTVIENWRSLTLFPNTSMVSSLPLMHIYGKLEKQELWNLENTKEIVRAPLCQIIASTFENRWFQMSYTSGRLAMMMENLRLRGTVFFEKYLRSEFQKFRNSKVTQIKPYFWRNAVHYWNPNLASSETNMMDRCIQPHRRKYPNLYWVGEAISTKQGWMEGALKTSLRLYDILTRPVQKLKKELPKEYVIYDGRILNVERWKHVHPGSRQAIENHLFEDITCLWNTYHPKEASKYMVLLEEI